MWMERLWMRQQRLFGFALCVWCLRGTSVHLVTWSGISCGIGYPQLCGSQSQSTPPDTGRPKPASNRNRRESFYKRTKICSKRRQATPSKPQQCLVSKLIVIRCGFDFGSKPSPGGGVDKAEYARNNTRIRKGNNEDRNSNIARHSLKPNRPFNHARSILDLFTLPSWSFTYAIAF